MDKKTSHLARKLGQNISKYRRKKGLTSEALAYGVGFSKGYLSDLENGNKIPSIVLLSQIAEELDVTLKELVE